MRMFLNAIWRNFIFFRGSQALTTAIFKMFIRGFTKIRTKWGSEMYLQGVIICKTAGVGNNKAKAKQKPRDLDTL